MRNLRLFLAATSLLASSHAWADDPVFLALLENPFNIGRETPPGDIFGVWEHNLATPDGAATLTMTVDRGPDDLVLVNIEASGDAKHSSGWSLNASLVLYRSEELLFCVVTPRVHSSEILSAGVFFLPVHQLVSLEVEDGKINVRLPSSQGLHSLGDDGLLLHPLSGSRYILIGKSARIESLLLKSVSPEFFCTESVVFTRPRHPLPN